ncbi:MAG: hypothetical protein HY253_02510 [Burkholderiales bacterium]|nr:hypothetical protein [Burkholderiales bacterium]
MPTYLIALLLALGGAQLCQAQSKPTSDTLPKHPTKEEGGHRKPPQHAYDLCKGKKEGNAVQIVTPRGQTLAATCTPSHDGLFARPEHPPHDDKEDQKPQKPER